MLISIRRGNKSVVIMLILIHSFEQATNLHSFYVNILITEMSSLPYPTKKQ